MAKLFANSGDPDQMPQNAASDLGLHCLPITLLWVSQLQWVNDFQSLGKPLTLSMLQAKLATNIEFPSPKLKLGYNIEQSMENSTGLVYNFS